MEIQIAKAINNSVRLFEHSENRYIHGTVATFTHIHAVSLNLDIPTHMTSIKSQSVHKQNLIFAKN